MDTIEFNEAQQFELMRRAEGHFFDIKRGDIAPAKLERTFVAMANADGGEVFVGIDNDDTLPPASRIHGFRNIEAANNHVLIPEGLLEPRMLGVVFEFLRLPDDPSQLILHAIIPKSDKVHYTSSKECYKRQGAQNLPIKGKDIESLIFLKGQQSYEDTIATMPLAELAKSEYLSQYLSLVPSAQPAEMFLRKQRLVVPSERRGSPELVRCAAVLLFDDEPQAALSTRSGVKITQFKSGTGDQPDKYSRSRLVGSPISVEGPTDLLIRRAVAKVQEIMDSSYFYVRKQYRKLKYPPAAIHEVIANAVLHRDYSLKDDVHINIHDGRIEVTSPGRLPGHITPENILDERFMRNPKLVRLVNKLPEPPNKDIGEGLNTAFREMELARLKLPVIEELEAAVRVTLLHEPIATPERQIVDYLVINETIQNKKARELTAKESMQSVYKIFMRMVRAGLIELVDENADVFSREYKLAKDWKKHWKDKDE